MKIEEKKSGGGGLEDPGSGWGGGVRVNVNDKLKLS